jgi:hypothetical protein
VSKLELNDEEINLLLDGLNALIEDDDDREDEINALSAKLAA